MPLTNPLRDRILAALALAAFAGAAQAQDRLPDAVDAALARAGVPPGALVAMVREVGGAAPPRLAWQVERPVAPASVMKLVTGQAALELLGPAYRWSTPVWLDGTVRGGVLNGDLVVKGTGDPNLPIERVWRLLRHVRRLGVREIGGDIVVDRSTFRLPPQDPFAFDGQGLRPYNVQADALMIEFKSLTFSFTPDVARGVAVITADPPLAGVAVDASLPLDAAPCPATLAVLQPVVNEPGRIGFAGRYPVACGERSAAVAYADPASFDERALRGLWRELGGRLRGGVRDGLAPATAPTFASTSPSLTEVLHTLDKYSNNVMARQLFLTLGAVRRGSGTPEASREVVQQWAADRLGAAAATLVVDNGSGLSREARVSAALLDAVLQRAWDGALMAELTASLPISGIDGSLVDAPMAPGRAHLKTGTLRDVTALAGYVLARSGRRYAVVGIVNHPAAAAARPALAALVDWAADDATP